jgi:PAS domain S-box-containing protein
VEARALRPNGRARAHPLWRLAAALLILFALFAACLPLMTSRVANDAPRVARGTVDLSGMGRLDGVVPLSGEWQLTWRGGPAEGPPVGTTRFVHVPGRWSSEAEPDGRELPDLGVATYSLVVTGLAPGTYALHLSPIYGASRLWIDGRVVSSSGDVALRPEQARSQRRNQEVSFEHRGGQLRIAIDVAALHHRDNGLENMPLLGSTAAMRDYSDREWGKDILYLSTLLLLSLVAAVTFLFRPQDRAALYISIACALFVPLSAIFSYDNMLLIAVPWLDFRGMLAVQFLGGIGAIAALLAYTRELFPKETPRPLFLLLLGGFGLLFIAQAVVLALGDTLLASDISRLSTGLGMLSLLTMIGIVLIAAVRGRKGAAIYLIGLSAFTFMIMLRSAVANALLRADEVAAIDLPAIGALLFLISHFVLLAERLATAITASEHINRDLRQLISVSSAITSETDLGALLGRIVEATSRILDADRASLFLHDPEQQQLTSAVAEGMSSDPISIPDDFGIAGAAFTSGEIVAVRNAYADARFHAGVDSVTGYVTRSVLACPIVARDGRRLGVLEALNRRGRKGFDEDDKARIAAFAAQAAIALDNARLFTQVTESRDYSESILSSMSSAVITLDRSAQVAKFNRAACKILGITKTHLNGADARELLALGNPELIPEINAVMRSGESRLLLDVDLRNGRGQTKSVNISLIALRGGAEDKGVLILMDDISEGKRLQGTMRRFMPQEAVEQVLSRGDELLFGSSCTASVLFADIRGFTTLVEELSARETVEMLNQVFGELVEAVEGHGGLLDKFMGDAVMAVFGAPLVGLRDADNAARAALEMQQRVSVLNEARAAEGKQPIRIGCGIATGEVVAGTIGSLKRMDYTVIGDSVNLASRLQGLTKTYGTSVIACGHTAEALSAGLSVRELDTVRVRGRREPVKIFELRSLEPGHAELFLRYDEALTALRERDWTFACAHFAALERDYPNDAPTHAMLNRARTFRDHPPQVDWDGVWDDRLQDWQAGIQLPVLRSSALRR